MDLPARVTALDLDRGVPDGEPIAQPPFQVSYDVLGLGKGAILHDHVDAERRLGRRKGPYVKVVHAADQLSAGDLVGHRREVDLARGALEQQVHGLAYGAWR